VFDGGVQPNPIVKEKYGINGNESVAPPVILKMMLLLILYNVRSERELALAISERLLIILNSLY
jgi:transposase